MENNIGKTRGPVPTPPADGCEPEPVDVEGLPAKTFNDMPTELLGLIARFTDPPTRKVMRELNHSFCQAATAESKKLQININQIHSLPEMLRALPNIEAISITSVGNVERAVDVGLAKLAEMAPELRRKIVDVNLEGASITAVGIAHLAGLTDLRSLKMVGMRGVTDGGLIHLQALRELRSLDLTANYITDAGFAHLQNMTQLQSLELAVCRITNNGLIHLEKLTQLQILDLRGYNLFGHFITGEGVVHLKSLKQLQSLFIGFKLLRGSFRHRAHASPSAAPARIAGPDGVPPVHRKRA